MNGPICLLSHETSTAEVVVSHDPRQPQPYAIRITRLDGPWLGGAVFSIDFQGAGALTISTDRHKLSDGNATLMVADSGFGNVLRGLEANETALAVLDDQSVALPLSGAAPEVEKFRTCANRPSV